MTKKKLPIPKTNNKLTEKIDAADEVFKDKKGQNWNITVQTKYVPKTKTFAWQYKADMKTDHSKVSLCDSHIVTQDKMEPLSAKEFIKQIEQYINNNNF